MECTLILYELEILFFVFDNIKFILTSKAGNFIYITEQIILFVSYYLPFVVNIAFVLIKYKKLKIT